MDSLEIKPEYSWGKLVFWVGTLQPRIFIYEKIDRLGKMKWLVSRWLIELPPILTTGIIGAGIL